MIKLHVNGTEHELNVSEKMPILWALRDHLGLTGAKYGCGLGICGSCSVLLEGRAIRSCITPLSQAIGKQIITVEGLDGENPFLRKTWTKHNVPQCGFCQSGQLISALSLLNEVPSPSDKDIDEAMAGNICRCGTYTRIRIAIKDAAILTEENEAPQR